MKKIGNILRRKKRLIALIKKYEAYLFPGKYIICSIGPNRYAWIRVDCSEKMFRSTKRQNKFSFKNAIISKMLKSTYIINKSTLLSCGTSLYVSRKGNVKIFSKDMKSVAYFVSDKSLFDKAVHYNRNYAAFFGKSIIDGFDNSCNRINERFISEKYNWRLNKSEVENATFWLINNSIEYLKSLDMELKLCKFDEFAKNVKGRTSNHELIEFVDELSSLFDIENYCVPFVYQHNDVVLSNILKDDKGFTLFDYEFYGENVFFYDCFMWMVWEAVKYSHDDYLLDYLDGKYDDKFSLLFSQVNTSFDTNRRKDYVYMYIIANINIHLITGDGTNIRKYKRVLNIL